MAPLSIPQQNLARVLYDEGKGKHTPVQICSRLGCTLDDLVEILGLDQEEELPALENSITRRAPRVRGRSRNPSNRPSQAKYYKGMDHLNELARAKGYESHQERMEFSTLDRINPRTGKPFESVMEYRLQKRNRRAKKPKYQEFSRTIQEGLERLGKPQSWLAENIGVSAQTAGQYAAGFSMPRSKERLQEIYDLMKLSPKQLRKKA